MTQQNLNMRIERSKYTSPPSPVEAFRRVSSKIGRKSTNFSDDDSNHRLLDRSSWDQSDDQRDADVLPFNPTGKFVRKTTPLSPLGSLKSPRSMKKALMSRVNAVVEHNSYFGNHESRDDDESNVGLLSHDGQYESRWADDKEDAEDNVAYTHQNSSGASAKPLLPDLVDLGGFSDDSSESRESSKENIGATAAIITSVSGTSVSERESLAYSHDSAEEVVQEPEDDVADDEIVEEEVGAIALNARARSASPELEDTHVEGSIEFEGSSSTVDFDDDLSLAEHPDSMIQDLTPVEVVEESEPSEKKSITSSPTDIKSYASYTKQECPVVVSSSDHGDVILLSPKGFENVITAEAASSMLSTRKEEDSQDLSSKFEAVVLADPVVSRQIEAKTEHTQNEQEKAASNEEEDEFVISDDWSEDNSVGDSSDPFGECVVNEAAVQNITEHRLEGNAATSLGREESAEEEEIDASDNDSSSEDSNTKPVLHLADLGTSQLSTKSSSSADLASFNQIWEGSSKLSEESGSDSEEVDESKVSGKMSSDDDAWVVSRELMVGFRHELSASVSSGDDKSDSSEKQDKDNFISLNNYWSSEWNDLTVDDSTNYTETNTNVENFWNEEDVDEETEAHDKYSIALEEDDNNEFYGCGIVKSSADYSYESFGLETISEEGEFEEDEPVMSMPKNEDESVAEQNVKIDELVTDRAKECIDGKVIVDADEDISSAAKSRNIATEEVIVVETVNEYSSDEEEYVAEEKMVPTTTSNHAIEVQNEAQSDVLQQLWSKIDEYQATSSNIAEAVEQAPRQILSTKVIAPVKKRAVVKHSIRNSQRSSLPRAKRAGNTDRNFDDLSRFLDGGSISSSLDSFDTSSNHTEVLLEDGNGKIDSGMKRTSVKRHVLTRLIAPVSAFVNKRRSSEQQGQTKSGTDDFTDGNQCDESHVESHDDRQARELTEMLSAAMMARDLEKRNKDVAFAKQLAEVREAIAMEEELADIEGDLHYGLSNTHDNAILEENFTSSDEDDSHVEILEEEKVTATTTAVASNETETKELHDLWSKIDEYQANGKSLDTTQVAMMADMLNSITAETTHEINYPARPLRSLKHTVSIRKRAVVNAKAKKSKYDVSYIEANSIAKNNTAAKVETGNDLISTPVSSGINEPSEEIDPSNIINEPSSEESKDLAEASPPLPDLETLKTCESEDLDAPTQICLIPSAMSINSLASIISADKSSDSSLGGVSKDRSDLSKGSLVSKLYSENTDLAETLASTQCELEKALKQLERMRMEKDEMRSKQPVPLPKSSFDDYFEPDALIEEEEDVSIDKEWDEADVACSSSLCEI